MSEGEQNKIANGMRAAAEAAKKYGQPYEHFLEAADEIERLEEIEGLRDREIAGLREKHGNALIEIERLGKAVEEYEMRNHAWKAAESEWRKKNQRLEIELAQSEQARDFWRKATDYLRLRGS